MALKAQLSWFACVNGSPDLPPCVLLFGCFVKGSFNTQRGVKNLIGQFGVLHPLHPQCGCSSEKMCEQRTWTVCCFLLGPKPITLESITSKSAFEMASITAPFFERPPKHITPNTHPRFPTSRPKLPGYFKGHVVTIYLEMKFS